MRFLIDESVTVAVTHFLRNKGYDTLSVAELTPSARDADILQRAEAEDRIVITNDKDFGELVFRNSQQHRGVLLFRLRDGSDANYIRTLSILPAQHSEHLPGNFARVREGSVRIRGKLILLLTDNQETS